MQFDAIVLGYGPAGAVAVNMLEQRGWRVAVVDRLAEPFPLPRAIGFDGETSRTFQELGLTEEIQATTTPYQGAEFVNAKDERVIGIDASIDHLGMFRHPDTSFFHQPTLEKVLRRRAQKSAKVTAFLAHEADMPSQNDDAVAVKITDLETQATRTLTAPWLIAADGAASPVRKGLGYRFESLGYDCQWLVVDACVKDRTALPTLCKQICDPDRIITYVPGVNDLVRWEIRSKPGETHEDLLDEDFIWSIIGRWVDKKSASLTRTAVYQFHAAVADQWSDGRIFLVGDAAHQTPPFLGQGMVAGVRDVVNLVWKLNLIKEGRAPLSLLNTYELERKPHALDVVDWAVSVGKLMDAIAEAQITGNYPEDLSAAYGGTRGLPRLHSGVLARKAGDEDDGLVGRPVPQALISLDGGEPVLMDEVIGRRFAILSADDLLNEISQEQHVFLERIDAKILHLPKEVRKSSELDLLLHVHRAVILRPDRYIFGLVNDTHSLDKQLSSLELHFV